MENYRYEKETREIRKTFWFYFWRVFGIVLVLSLLSWGIKVILMPARTATDIMEQTLDADNVLDNYEWYKLQYEDWKAINVKIKQADGNADRFKNEVGPRKEWDYQDKEEYSRLTSIADGLRYQREDIEAKYNARSKMKNRSIFKSNDLPYQLINGEEDREE